MLFDGLDIDVLSHGERGDRRMRAAHAALAIRDGGVIVRHDGEASAGAADRASTSRALCGLAVQLGWVPAAHQRTEIVELARWREIKIWAPDGVLIHEDEEAAGAGPRMERALWFGSFRDPDPPSNPPVVDADLAAAARADEGAQAEFSAALSAWDLAVAAEAAAATDGGDVQSARRAASEAHAAMVAAHRRKWEARRRLHAAAATAKGGA